MKMKNEAVKELLRDYVGKMVERDSDDWPPKCFTFAYQAMRPEKRQDDAQKSMSLDHSER